MFRLSTASKRNRQGVDPRLIAIDDLAITLTLIDYGHGPYAGKRSAVTQNGLFLTGKSERDGYDKRSNHQDGNALDFYAYIDGAASWKPEHLAMVACAYFQAASILGYRIKWGGLWKSKKGGIYGWDMPHMELME